MYSTPDGTLQGVPDCSIRKPADQKLHALPRGLSRLAASFFARHRLGIHHAPEQLARQILLPAVHASGIATNDACVKKSFSC